MNKSILLTFDIEEFDMPDEFGEKISEQKKLSTSLNGLKKIVKLLDKLKIKSTFFVTAKFAKEYPPLIKEIKKKDHEIACHGYLHSDNYFVEDFSRIKKAKNEIEKIIDSEIKGFRAPRFEIKNISELSKFGFTYDSSSHPTIAPGKYCNFREENQPHKKGKITEIPPSTLPLFPFLRAPINWFMFKNFPACYHKNFARINFLFSDYLMLVFHPWEFSDLSKFKIPSYAKKISGEALLNKLEKYLVWLKTKGEFITVNKFKPNIK